MWRKKSDEGPASGARASGRKIVLAILGVVLLFFVVWQGSRTRREIGLRTLTVYSFSAMEAVMVEGILPSFQSRWGERTGEHVEFITTFAGSGTITDQIIRKFPAEIAVLSSEIDANRLVRRGALPGPTWRTLPHGGVFARSPMVIRVREGNPKGIAALPDLGAPGISVLSPDPATSGAGEWGILAVYGSALGEPADAARAAAFLGRFWERVTVGGSSARIIGSRFDEGVGDALITYEAEAIAKALAAPTRAPFVIPPATIWAEPVVVRIGRNVTAEQKDLVDSLVAFFWTETAQKILIEHGFRSVDDTRNAGDPRFGAIERSFTLEEIGGPEQAEEILLPLISRGAAEGRAGS
jgi:sulfate transport system substrate-binding protein